MINEEFQMIECGWVDKKTYTIGYQIGISKSGITRTELTIDNKVSDDNTVDAIIKAITSLPKTVNRSSDNQEEPKPAV